MAAIDVAIAGEPVATEKSVAEHCQDAAGNYVVVLVRGLTKAELISEVSNALSGVDPDAIVSVDYHADRPFLIWPFWRRNSALIVLKPDG